MDDKNRHVINRVFGGEDAGSFKVSVVTPAYNTETYLQKSIDSVLNQTIGFEENVQLILVNDGSADGTGAICERVYETHPHNVVFIDKQNGGVSAARNDGLDHATGEYITFLDSDDFWDADAFERLASFLGENEDIPFVGARIVLAGRNADRKHPLDFKFDKGDRVVDLRKDPKSIVMHIHCCMFRREAFEKRRFDEDMDYCEDALLANKILLESMRYGVMQSVKYHYTKRSEPGALTFYESTKKRMTQDLPKFAQRVIQAARQDDGSLPEFIERTLLYELKWRLTQQPSQDVTEDELEAYKEQISGVLKEVSAESIARAYKIAPALKTYMFELKYGTDVWQRCSWQNGRAVFRDGSKGFNFKERGIVSLNLVERKEDALAFEGYCKIDFARMGCSLAFRGKQGFEAPIETRPWQRKDAISFEGEAICPGMWFHVEAPIVEGQEYRFAAVLPSGEEVVLRPSMGLWSCFGNHKELKDCSFWLVDSSIVRYVDSRFCIERNTFKKRFALERRLQKVIAANATEDLARLRRKALAFRRRHRKEKIWIFSDRVFKGGDNAENLFKYAAQTLRDPNVKLYFLFDKEENPTDYERIRQYGEVVSPRSEEYRILFLAADKIISSHFDRSVLDPFLNDSKYFKNLYDFDFVYLTHGVMPGDLSGSLNKMAKNIKLFVTSSRREYEGILSGDYLYNEEQVKLTGMPRHDALGGDVKKKIVFLPTWRSKLAGKCIEEMRDRQYSEGFKDTHYCHFYNALINDERLNEALEKAGYEGEFYVHPAFRTQACDFHGDKLVKVGEHLADYESILNEAALMVTDYSSVAFDFAYQRKPIVYCQFDKESIAKDHFYQKGYFDYERDGFGPITQSLDETVDAIVGYLERDCRNTDEYRARGDAFFAFNDHKNCERVFKALLEMDS